jgi:hypothetical protein
LTVGYGKELSFDAFSFTPVNNCELTYSIGVVIDEEKRTSSREWREAPCFSIQLVDPIFVLPKVQSWLDDIIFSKLQGWPDFCCGIDCFSWQRSILQSICNFFSNTVQFLTYRQDEWPESVKSLHKALELSVLIFVMGHQILIPENEKSRLAEKLNMDIPEGTVSCRLINKIFKMALVEKIRELAQDALAGLNLSFRDKDASTWGCDFCVVILLLTVAAENQISLDDIVACAISRGNYNRSREDAAKDIQSLESALPDMLIGLFNAKYKSHRNSFNPFKSQQQLEKDDIPHLTSRLVRDILAAVQTNRELIQDLSSQSR